MIYSSLDYYSLITLQQQPGIVSNYLSQETLEKYRLGGIFDRQGINGLLLLNLEATLLIFVISFLTYAVISVLAETFFKAAPGS